MSYHVIFIMLAVVGALFAEQSPRTQPSTPAYRGNDELTRLRKSAERGDANAEWDLCQLYDGTIPPSYHGKRILKDEAVAVEWCKQAATHGHLRASGTLAAFYYFGRGVPQDFAQALIWVRPPATGGVSEAQFLLGLLHANGQGVQRDDTEAFSWFLKSAEQGYALAQNFIAAAYTSGLGTRRNRIEAQKWMNVCAERKSDVQDKCIEGRVALARTMSAADVAEAEKRADQWFRTCSRPSEPRWNMVCQ